MLRLYGDIVLRVDWEVSYPTKFIPIVWTGCTLAGDEARPFARGDPSFSQRHTSRCGRWSQPDFKDAREQTEASSTSFKIHRRSENSASISEIPKTSWVKKRRNQNWTKALVRSTGPKWTPPKTTERKRHSDFRLERKAWERTWRSQKTKGALEVHLFRGAPSKQKWLHRQAEAR